MSERDGWSHLYLYDGITGRVKNQITKGDVGRAQRRPRRRSEPADLVHGKRHESPARIPISFTIYRINFDGTGLIAYTSANGTARGQLVARPRCTTSTPTRASTRRPSRSSAARAIERS